MSYRTRLNPLVHKILVVWICICVLFAGILPRPQKAEAFAPLVALGAADLLAVGTLAVAAGLSFPASQKVITAVAQDMWSRGGTLLQDAVHNSTNTQITVGVALWQWLKDYALNTAPLHIGSTLNIAQASVIEGYTNVGNLNYTSMGTADKYIIPISAGTVMGTLVGGNTNSTQVWINFTQAANGTVGQYLLQNLNYSAVRSNVIYPTARVVIKDMSKTGTPEVYHYEKEYTGSYTGTPFQIDIDGKTGLVSWTVAGIAAYSVNLAMTLTNGTVAYPRFDFMSGWRAGNIDTQLHIDNVQYRAGNYVEQPMDSVIVGGADLALDPPYTRAIGETDTAIAFPVAKDAATTTAAATQAITGVQAKTLAQTDVATNTPKIPPTPPDSPKVPWYAFFSYFLDMLRAMLEYTIRLVSFLITLQSISSLSMGEYDGIFQWFKNMKWGGIDLYSIVMSMFGLSISLVIYRMVRKV